jgi:hypothetical protein
MPGAGRAHGPLAEKKAGGSHHRSAETSRHSLRDGFTDYTCSSPGIGSFAPVPRQHASALRWAPAPRRQDHTTSPCASDCSSARTTTLQPDSPTASTLACPDDRDTPLVSGRTPSRQCAESDRPIANCTAAGRVLTPLPFALCRSAAGRPRRRHGRGRCSSLAAYWAFAGFAIGCAKACRSADDRVRFVSLLGTSRHAASARRSPAPRLSGVLGHTGRRRVALRTKGRGCAARVLDFALAGHYIAFSRSATAAAAGSGSASRANLEAA